MIYQNKYINGKTKYKRMVFSIGNKCTAHCKYCDYPKLQKHIQFVTEKNIYKTFDIFNKLYDIPKYEKILNEFFFRVEGAEIGDVPKNLLDIWFSKENPFQIFYNFTNGTFFEKGYYELYKEYIGEIYYHLTKIDEKNINLILKYQDVIDDISIVLVEKDIPKILEHIRKYPDIIWSPYPLLNRKKHNLIIETKYYDKIKVFLNEPNVFSAFKPILERYNTDEDELKDKRIFCSNDYSHPFINLMTMKIHRCMASNDSNSIDFTFENMKKYLDNEELLFPPFEDICRNCNNARVYEENIKNRKLLELSKVMKKYRNEEINYESY